MAIFEVGEVAIVAQSVLPDFPVGSEVTIQRIFELPPNPECKYVIYEDNRTIVCGSDITLRKKRPPEAERKREERGSWNLCPWRPAHVRDTNEA